MNKDSLCALSGPLSSTTSSDHKLRTYINDCSQISMGKVKYCEKLTYLGY